METSRVGVYSLGNRNQVCTVWTRLRLKCPWGTQAVTQNKLVGLWLSCYRVDHWVHEFWRETRLRDMDVELSAYWRQVKLWDWMRQSRTEKEELAKEPDKEQLEKGKENRYSVMEINNNNKMFYKGESKDFFGSPEVRTSLVVQRLRLLVPKAGDRVRSLVKELAPTYHNEDHRSCLMQLRPGTAK